jgi:hypothetical protein
MRHFWDNGIRWRAPENQGAIRGSKMTKKLQNDSKWLFTAGERPLS